MNSHFEPQNGPLRFRLEFTLKVSNYAWMLHESSRSGSYSLSLCNLVESGHTARNTKSHVHLNFNTSRLSAHIITEGLDIRLATMRPGFTKQFVGLVSCQSARHDSEQVVQRGPHRDTDMNPHVIHAWISCQLNRNFKQFRDGEVGQARA